MRRDLSRGGAEWGGMEDTVELTDDRPPILAINDVSFRNTSIFLRSDKSYLTALPRPYWHLVLLLISRT